MQMRSRAITAAKGFTPDTGSIDFHLHLLEYLPKYLRAFSHKLMKFWIFVQ